MIKSSVHETVPFSYGFDLQLEPQRLDEAGCRLGTLLPERRRFHNSQERARNAMNLPRITFGTVAKLLLASFAVGMVLAYFDIRPEEIINYARDRLADVFGNATQYASEATTFVLLGAVIVVPLWLVSYIWRALRNKQ